MHNFGLSNNCYDLINAAYNKKVPIAITPVYSWPSLRFAVRSGINLKHKLDLGIYALLHNASYLNKLTYLSKMLKMSSKILTDSNAEKNILMKTYKLKEDKFQIANYGVDKRFFNANKKTR